MDWSASTLWWLAAGVLVAAELSSGSFYMLMLALGCVAGALAAHAGLASSVQLVVAAVAGSGATALWYLRRARLPKSAPAASNRDVNLDIGGTVLVLAWNEDGTARATYRGAAWSLRFAGQGAALPGDHKIIAIEGSRLVVTAATPSTQAS